MTKLNIGDEIIHGMTEAIEYIRGNETGSIVHKVEIPDFKNCLLVIYCARSRAQYSFHLV